MIGKLLNRKTFSTIIVRIKMGNQNRNTAAAQTFKFHLKSSPFKSSVLIRHSSLMIKKQELINPDTNMQEIGMGAPLKFFSLTFYIIYSRPLKTNLTRFNRRYMFLISISPERKSNYCLSKRSL